MTEQKSFLGRYKYYKDDRQYVVTGVAMDTATQSKVVLYQALYDIPDLAAEYGLRPTFTRPFEQFFSQIEWQGQMVDRYTRVDEK